MIEEWRPVLGFEKRYEVSNIGRVRSLLNNKNNCRNIPKKVPKILRCQIKKGPYKYRLFIIRHKNKRKVVYVHTAILESFLCPRPKGHQGCHNNGNSLDNRLENLRWATPLENTLDKNKHGTMHKGEEIFSAKLNKIKVKEIRKRYSNGEKAKYLAKEYGINWRTIYSVVLRETWKHI